MDQKEFNQVIKKQLQETIALQEKILNQSINSISAIATVIIKAYNNKKKVLWCGNGGSAADSQHLSCELVSKFYMDRPPLQSIALTTNTSILTAVSNDYSYDHVFERQVDALAEKGDVVIGISTSGTSTNVIKALKKGKEKGATTIAFIGENTKAMKPVADYILSIPSKDTPRIQEAHITIGHILCFLIEKTLFGKQ